MARNYHINKPYKIRTYHDLECFSNDILYKPYNRSLYNKRFLFLIYLYTLFIFLLIASIVSSILVITVIDEKESPDLYLGIEIGISIANFTPFISWIIYLLNTKNSLSELPSTPIEKTRITWLAPKSAYWGYYWSKRSTKWSKFGLIDISIVQILTMFNKLNLKDRKYLFRLVMNERDPNKYKFVFTNSERLAEIINYSKLSKAQLNLIYGLIRTLKYTDCEESFFIVEDTDDIRYKDRFLGFWWLLRINPKVFIVTIPLVYWIILFFSMV